MRDIKPYKTKQILSSRGNIEVTVKIIDYKGLSSVQKGYSNSTNIKAHFKQAYNEAVLNAVYKHFWNNGGYYINSRDYSISDLCESIIILDHEIIYFSDLNYYTFKRENIKGHYYTVIRKKGRYYQKEPHNSIDKIKLNSEYNFKESDKRVKQLTPTTQTVEKETKKRRKTLKTEKIKGQDRIFYKTHYKNIQTKI